jgi:hypothetical protein
MAIWDSVVGGRHAVSFSWRLNLACFLLHGVVQRKRGVSEGDAGMKLKEWRDVLTADFPSMKPVTQNTVDLALKEGRRFRGSMRVSTGRIWTDRDFERFRTRVLNTPLP